MESRENPEGERKKQKMRMHKATVREKPTTGPSGVSGGKKEKGPIKKRRGTNLHWLRLQDVHLRIVCKV